MLNESTRWSQCLPVRQLKRLIPRRYRRLVKGLYLRTLPPAAKRGLLASRLQAQARWCLHLGSPLYGTLLECTATDVETGGPCWDVLSVADRPAFGANDALPLRLMAAVHRLVLEGQVPELSPYFPSVGGNSKGDAWPAFRNAVEEHREVLTERLNRPVQTNEVGRSAALLGGFLLAARESALPLRLLEIGASAGLNLRWDRYRYEAGGAAWGDPMSPVKFTDVFVSQHPPFDVAAEIATRRGCDNAPLDPRSPEDQLTLMSHVWADLTHRLDLLKRALVVAQQAPAPVDQADACEWLSSQLDEPVPGVVTVVFHSLVIQYLDANSRRSLRALVERAGTRADDSAPLAWLRMEPGKPRAEVHLSVWPRMATTLIAKADTFGRHVLWLGE